MCIYCSNLNVTKAQDGTLYTHLSQREFYIRGICCWNRYCGKRKQKKHTEILCTTQNTIAKNLDAAQRFYIWGWKLSVSWGSLKKQQLHDLTNEVCRLLAAGWCSATEEKKECTLYIYQASLLLTSPVTKRTNYSVLATVLWVLIIDEMGCSFL